MKYGKLLQTLLEDLPPEFRDKFLSYKQLKKRIKQFLDSNSFPEDAFEPAPIQDHQELEEDVTVEEKEFIRLLNVELEKFNSFFTEKEEDYVIQLQVKSSFCRPLASLVCSRIEASEELLKIHTDLVTFHGEVVLMENYSALNYTGLVKILKKHDKRTGAVLRLPFIRRVLLQPFFSTELLSKLVQDCESLLSFFPPLPSVETCAVQRADGEGWDSNAEVPRDVQELLLLRGEDAQNIYKSSLAALRTLKEMRKRSSTVSSQSLPPCKFSRNETIDTVMNETLKPAPAVCVPQAL
ncbi:unnamed protein product [Sphagnum jensenii]|uniref:SPX domain-containing protein n=1 Tax=Sphagnum jensenii TaxID=128206 RepID=A0ABP0VZQ0_9BRYO